MTIEEEFFKTFGIEPIANKYECRCGTNTTQCNVETCKSKICDKTYCDQKQIGVCYPQITNRILLELICILNRYNENKGVLIFGDNIEATRNHILSLLTCNFQLLDDDSIKQVRSLFEDVILDLHN